jgi:hypothetical protein
MTKRLVTLVLLLSGIVFCALACGPRVHIRADHGKASRAFFQGQRLHAVAEKGDPQGLDSEEAAMIHANYRKQHGASGKSEPRDSPAKVLLVQETKDVKKR